MIIDLNKTCEPEFGEEKEFRDKVTILACLTCPPSYNWSNLAEHKHAEDEYIAAVGLHEADLPGFTCTLYGDEPETTLLTDRSRYARKIDGKYFVHPNQKTSSAEDAIRRQDEKTMQTLVEFTVPSYKATSVDDIEQAIPTAVMSKRKKLGHYVPIENQPVPQAAGQGLYAGKMHAFRACMSREK